MADIVAASGLILVLTPMIALVAALSYRPRLPLIQRRRAAGGAGRQHFTVYEFNGGAGPRAHGFSPRSFVRTFRGDQLPQLLNVIRGELSFFAAGSRPRLFAD
ncbi:MAG: sugar transferase [Alphaproteobacteria bacterium]|nr:sugar transferase [Alphaproteobacteria bacterium]